MIKNSGKSKKIGDLLNTGISKNNIKISCLQGIYDSFSLFPMALSLCVCTGFGAGSAVVTVLLCTLFSSLTGRFYSPSYLTVLPVFCVMYRFGAGAAGLTVALSGVFAVLLSLCKKKSFFDSRS